MVNPMFCDTPSRWVVGIGGVLTALAIGCGGDDQATPSEPAEKDAGTDIGADAVIEAPGDAVGEATADAVVAESLTVEVTYEAHPFYRWTGETAAPLEGALVVLELPDGSFVERLTDAAGKVVLGDDVLSAVDWSSETVTVSAYKEGTKVITFAGLSHEALFDTRGGLLRFGFWATKRAPLQLTATAIGTSGEANASVHVSTSTWLECVMTAASGPIAIEAESALAFSAVSYEYKQLPAPCPQRCVASEMLGWTRSDFGPAADGMDVQLDFGQSQTPTLASGRLVLPASPDSKLRLFGLLSVEVAVADDLEIGKPSRVELTADGSAFEYDLQYVPWDSEDYVMTYFGVYNGSSVSVAWETGYPEDGAVIDDLLDLPTLTSPSSAATPIPITDMIAWQTPDVVEAAGVVVIRGGEQVWLVIDDGVTGSGSMKLPRLPPSIDAAEVLGTTTLDAAFALLSKEPAGGGVWGRQSLVMFKIQP